MNVDKKLLPAPKQSYNEDMFNEDETVKLIHITTINVHQQNFSKGKKIKYNKMHLINDKLETKIINMQQIEVENEKWMINNLYSIQSSMINLAGLNGLQDVNLFIYNNCKNLNENKTIHRIPNFQNEYCSIFQKSLFLTEQGFQELQIPLLVLPFAGPQDSSSVNVILYFHGNGEDVGHTRYLLEVFQSELSMNVIAMEYAGYGTYKGTPVSIDQIKLDSLRVYDYIVKELGVPEKNIILFGRSFGTGPACFLANERKPGGVVLMSAFATIKLLMEDLGEKVETSEYIEHFNNEKLVEKIQSPCLLIHGEKDAKINVSQTKKLENILKQFGKSIKAVYPKDMTNNQFGVVEDITNNVKDFLVEMDIKVETIKYNQNPLAKLKGKQ